MRFGRDPIIASATEFSQRLVVVDDALLARECLVANLAAHGITAKEAWDLPSLIAAVDPDEPNIVLIRSGTDAALTLLSVSRRLGRSARVLVFDLSLKRESEIIAAAEAGAAGLHLCSESFAHLLDLIRTLSLGRARCSSEVSALLLRRVYSFAGQLDLAASLDSLSRREIEILQLIAQGLTNQQIASRLTLTLPTVKNHVHRMLTKLGVGSRAEAVSIYRANEYSTTAPG